MMDAPLWFYIGLGFLAIFLLSAVIFNAAFKFIRYTLTSPLFIGLGGLIAGLLAWRGIR